MIAHITKTKKGCPFGAIFKGENMATEEYSIGYEDGKSAGFDECMAQQRTWVGLTEKEVDDCYESIVFNPDIEPTRMGVYLEIEAKLKEKNT